MPNLPPVLVELRASIADFQAKMGVVRAELDKLDAKAATTGDKLATIGKGVTLGLATLVGGIGAAAVHFADQWDQAHARLQASLKAAGTSYGAHQSQIASLDKSMEHYGFTNAQVEDALSHAVVSTQDYGKAQDAVRLAVELAAARHIDLAQATDTVDKALTGNLRPLKQLGIDLPVVASNALKVKQAHDALAVAQDKLNKLLLAHPDAVNAASKAHAQYELALGRVQTAQQKLADLQSAHGQILDALSQRLSGQASAAADTFGGKLAAMRATGEDLLKSIGQKLIPVIQDLINITMTVINWFENHKAVAIALGAVIAGVLTIAVAAFAYKTAVDFATNVGNMAKGIAKVSQEAYAVVAKLLGFGTASTTAGAEIAATGAETEAAGAAMVTAGGEADAAAASFSTAATVAGGALSVLAAGAAAYMGTTALLNATKKSGPGHWVGSAADSVANWLGMGPAQAATGRYQADLTSADIPFLLKIVMGTIVSPGISASDARTQLHALGVGGFAEGGVVPGTGPQVAILHGGELVLSKATVDALGSGGMATIPALASAGAGGGGGGPVQLTVNLVVDGQVLARVLVDDLRQTLLRKQRGLTTLGFI
jgi:hypothetical protein